MEARAGIRHEPGAGVGGPAAQRERGRQCAGPRPRAGGRAILPRGGEGRRGDHRALSGRRVPMAHDRQEAADPCTGAGADGGVLQACLITGSGMNHQALSSFIWSVADLLRGDYKQSEYGKVILPFTVLRRLDCVLEPTKEAVLAEYAARKKAGVNPDSFALF